MKRKIFASTLLLVMIVLFAVTANADIIDSGTCGDNATWILDDSMTLSVNGAGSIAEYKVSLSPDTETEVLPPWYSYSESIKKVIIADGITRIGNYAFYNCHSLESIIIPDSVTSIGYMSFGFCKGLISVDLPGSITSIEDSAFYNCTGLTSVVIPNGVTSIGSRVFYCCKNLTDIDIPDGVKSIGDCAFYRCTKLVSVVMPDSLISIGDSAFYNCAGLTSVVIPNGVTSIGSHAFYGCGGLSYVDIPDNAASIGDSAFYNCTGLVSVDIPESLTSIGKYVFYDCSALASICVDGDNQYYSSEDGVLFNKDKTTLVMYPEGKESVTYTIPSSVTSIGDMAFWNCGNITSMVIPSGVTSIGEGAFGYCSGLTSITIPESVVSIGMDTLIGCSSLTSVVIDSGNEYYSFENGFLFNKDKTAVIEYIFGNDSTNYVIPNGVTDIGNYAFSGCSDLISVFIPDSVISIGNGAFSGCYRLQTIYGIAGSYAETYSKSGWYTFVPLEDAESSSGIGFDTRITLIIDRSLANVNGTYVFNDAAPIIANNRTMLPARFVAENLGAAVSWNDAEKKVTIKNDTTTIHIIIGSDTAYVNGEAKKLDSPAFLRSARTYTPVRFICESLGANVEWDEANRRVIITK